MKRLLLVLLLSGCALGENVDLRTIDRAREMCAAHGGLASVKTRDTYEFSGDTMASSQSITARCRDSSTVWKLFEERRRERPKD